MHEDKKNKNSTNQMSKDGEDYKRNPKKKMVNIRMHHEDVKKIQAKAVNLGIPYQTLIGCVLHLYAHDKIDLDL